MCTAVSNWGARLSFEPLVTKLAATNVGAGLQMADKRNLVLASYPAYRGGFDHVEWPKYVKGGLVAKRFQYISKYKFAIVMFCALQIIS